MPSDKRARQRALRDEKVAVQERHDKRVRLGRRSAFGLVGVGIIIGLIVLLSSGGSKPPKKTATSTTTTTTASASTTTSSSTTTTAVAAIAPTCPPATATGAATRVIAFTTAPPKCIATNAVFNATFKTDVGTFVVQMKAASSYAAVNNFVFLARYHFYDGLKFHRVIPGFVVQGGDPKGNGTGGPGYSFTGNTPPSSCSTNNSCYPLGAVAMANSSGVSTNGSQFFVVVGTSGEQLPPDYTLFGQVTSGMPVVQKIAADGTSGGTPKVLHHMLSVTVAQVAA